MMTATAAQEDRTHGNRLSDSTNMHNSKVEKRRHIT
jgi:hypothetical protein